MLKHTNTLTNMFTNMINKGTQIFANTVAPDNAHDAPLAPTYTHHQGHHAKLADSIRMWEIFLLLDDCL